MCLQAGILPGDLNGAVSFDWARAGKRQAAFLCLERSAALDDFRIQHADERVAVCKGDDALALPDHVRCHADAFMLMRPERFEQVLRKRGVFCARRLRGGAKGRSDLS